jgi:hypothetical protein
VFHTLSNDTRRDRSSLASFGLDSGENGGNPCCSLVLLPGSQVR